MIEKWIKWFLGEKITSSLVGIGTGAITGAAAVAVTGNLRKEALLTGAVGGAASAIAGASGRMAGEK